MTAWFLTWNPERYAWDDLGDIVRKVRSGESARSWWSTGRTRRIKPGDRVYLVRQGSDRPGICCSGFAATEVYEKEHWEDEGKSQRYIDIDFELAFDPDVEPIFPKGRYQEGLFESLPWGSQTSGVSVKPEAEEALEREWQQFAKPSPSGEWLTPALFELEDRASVQIAYPDLPERHDYWWPATLRRDGELWLLEFDAYGLRRPLDLIELHEDDPDGFRGVSASLGEIEVLTISASDPA